MTVASVLPITADFVTFVDQQCPLLSTLQISQTLNSLEMLIFIGFFTALSDYA